MQQITKDLKRQAQVSRVPAAHQPDVAHNDDQQRILRVLIIDGHPRKDSFCSAIASILERAATRRTVDCRTIRLRDLEFNTCLINDRLEPALHKAQEDILWSEILVFVYPTWWGTMPALLKGFLDRSLRPGFAFCERSDGGWRGCLQGRSALLVTTMDTPRWIYRWLLGAPGHHAMRDATLGFCGISPIRILEFGPVRTSSLSQRRNWLAQIAREGRSLKNTFLTGRRVRAISWFTAARLHFYVQPWLAYTTGSAIAMNMGYHWQWSVYLLGCGAIFIVEFLSVITNELEDFASDRINENSGPFTGGSRVMVESRLSSTNLQRARHWALACLTPVVTIGVWGAANPWGMLSVGGVALALGFAYSVPPLRLCSRGLGELNVAITHSFMVILFGFVAQGGSLWAKAPWLVSLPLCIAVLPAIILAGFPDMEADAKTGKKTLAVRLGRKRTSILAGTAAFLAALLSLFSQSVLHDSIYWLIIPALLHATVLCHMIHTFYKAGAHAGRIDGMLILALTYMLWFAVIPLAFLLIH